MVMRKPLNLQLINYEYMTEQTEKVLNFEEITGCSSVQVACVAGGIRGRGKVLVYERRSREENGEERL